MEQSPLHALPRYGYEDRNEGLESSRAECTRKRRACGLAEMELAWIAEDDSAINQQSATSMLTVRMLMHDVY